MAYFMIAVIVDNKSNIVGYRLTSIGGMGFRCLDIEVNKLINLLASGTKVENIKLDGNDIVTVGSIDRYTKLSLSGSVLTDPAYTVLMAGGGEALLCDIHGNLRLYILEYLNNHKLKLTNAKLVIRNGTLIISSLSGASIQNLDISNILSGRKHKIMEYRPIEHEKWKFNWLSE